MLCKDFSASQKQVYLKHVLCLLCAPLEKRWKNKMAEFSHIQSKNNKLLYLGMLAARHIALQLFGF